MWHSNKWLDPKHWLFPTAADMYYNIYRQLFPSTKTIKKRRGHMGLGLNVWVMIQKLGNCVCFMNVVLLCMICNDMGAPGRELKCSRGARLLPQPCQATLQPNNFEILQSFTICNHLHIYIIHLIDSTQRLISALDSVQKPEITDKKMSRKWKVKTCSRPELAKWVKT